MDQPPPKQATPTFLEARIIFFAESFCAAGKCVLFGIRGLVLECVCVEEKEGACEVLAL